MTVIIGDGLHLEIMRIKNFEAEKTVKFLHDKDMGDEKQCFLDKIYLVNFYLQKILLMKLVVTATWSVYY